MRKTITKIAIILILIFYIATPYLAMNKIKKAADARNYDEVSEYIEYQTLRKNIKEQIDTRMFKQVKRSDNKLLAGFSFAVSGLLTNGFVDTYVTPNSLMNLMQGVLPKNRKINTNKASRDTEYKINNKSFIDVEVGYLSLNKFYININEKFEQRKKIKFILERKYLFNWKITNIILPI